MTQELLHTVKFDANGLIPAIVQDAQTQQVLMMAWMNAESLQRTLAIGESVFWSRSRQEFWHKGATSGNTQKVVEIRYDCDGDTLLLLVDPAGPACHTGEVSCFFNQIVTAKPPPPRPKGTRPPNRGGIVKGQRKIPLLSDQ